jgi:DUF4097 and DUF4098 domain-containing protein YvlB
MDVMMISKTLLTLFTVAAFSAPAAPAGAQPSRERMRTAVRERIDSSGSLYQQGREEQTDRQTKTLKLGADGELDLHNIAGDIVVTRGGGSEATVEIVKTARGRTAQDAKEMLSLVDVAVTERNGRAEVKTVYPQDEQRGVNNRRNINVSVAYTVTAPPGTRITIGSVSGSIRVADIKGDLSLNSISGSVNIANGGRITTAKSISGNVEVTDTQIDGGIDADSISGSVLVRKVSARRLTLGSISGGVVMQDVQCERVEAHSISGTIEYGGTLAKNGRYELASHSGDVRIAVGGSAGFELEANSFSGAVRSDLPLTSQDTGDGSGRRGMRRTVRGVFGDGSAVLSLTTFSGNIVVSRR